MGYGAEAPKQFRDLKAELYLLRNEYIGSNQTDVILRSIAEKKYSLEIKLYSSIT
jgi:hypothetical protein